MISCLWERNLSFKDYLEELYLTFIINSNESLEEYAAAQRAVIEGQLWNKLYKILLGLNQIKQTRCLNNI